MMSDDVYMAMCALLFLLFLRKGNTVVLIRQFCNLRFFICQCSKHVCHIDISYIMLYAHQMSKPWNVDDLYLEIGKRISAARIEFGMTQAELGQELSLSRTSITNIEGGRQKILVHTLLEISSLLQVEIMDLLPQLTSEKDTVIKPKLLKSYNDEIRKFVERAE